MQELEMLDRGLQNILEMFGVVTCHPTVMYLSLKLSRDTPALGIKVP